MIYFYLDLWNISGLSPLWHILWATAWIWFTASWFVYLVWGPASVLKTSVCSIWKTTKDAKNLTEMGSKMKRCVFNFLPQTLLLTENCKISLLQFLVDKHPCLKSFYTLVFPKSLSLTKTWWTSPFQGVMWTGQVTVIGLDWQSPQCSNNN